MPMIGIGIAPGFGGGIRNVVSISGTFEEGSTINLLADADFVDDGTSVEFFEVTAGSLGTDASGPPWTEEQTAVTPGLHGYYIEVDGGAPSRITQINVTPQAPTLGGAGNENVFTNLAFEFTATTFDDSETDSLSFRVTGPGGYDQTFTGVFDTDHWEYTWTTTGLTPGTYTRRAIRATAGGTASSETADMAVAVFSPSLMTGILDWGRTDLDCVSTGGNTTWDWQVFGMSFTAADANAPTINATDATLNNLQTLSFVRVNSDRLIATAGVDRPAPATTPTYTHLLLKQDTWNASAGIFSAGTQNLALFQSGTTPNIAQNNNATANANAGAVLGQWSAIRSLNTGSTSDSLVCQGTTASGASAGNNNPGATWTIGSNAALTAFSGITFYAGAVFSQVPVAYELAAYELDLATRIASSAPFS
jgi:hypothetical protein